MDFTKKIDFSSISDFCTCQRKFFFKHILCLVPDSAPNVDLVFGGAWHYGLEKAYQALRDNPDISAINTTEIAAQSFQKFWDVEGSGWFDPDASYPKSPGRAGDMYYNYFSEFLSGDSTGRVIATESPFVINLGETLPNYIGRLDLVMDFDGWLYIYEHKTSKYVNDAIIAGFDNSFQCEGYLTAGHIYYDKIPRVLYNIALCQKSKIDFTRHEVTRSKSAIDRFLTELRQIADSVTTQISDFNIAISEGLYDSKADIFPYFPRRWFIIRRP